MHATAFLKSPAEHAPGAIVALYGGERFLKQAALKALTESVLGKSADDQMALVRLTGKDVDLVTVVDTLLTVSMWTPRQVVLIEDAEEFVTKFRAGLEKYLERPAKKSVLILDVKSWPSTTRLAKKTAQIGLPLECSPLKPAELVTWLIEACKNRHGKKLERPAAQSLTELAGTDLGLLDQELAKLAAYAGAGAAITSQMVHSLVGGWKAETTWKMLDAVRDGQLGPALELLDKLLTSGEHPLKLLGGVNYSFRPLGQVTELTRMGMPLGTALSQAGVKPFQTQGATDYLRRIGRARAERLLQALLQADLDLKGGSFLPERMIVEKLLLQLAGKS